MVAASRFGDVSDGFLSSLLDESVVFTALLVVFYSNNYPSCPHGLLGHSPFDLEGPVVWPGAAVEWC